MAHRADPRGYLVAPLFVPTLHILWVTPWIYLASYPHLASAAMEWHVKAWLVFAAICLTTLCPLLWLARRQIFKLAMSRAAAWALATLFGGVASYVLPQSAVSSWFAALVSAVLIFARFKGPEDRQPSVPPVATSFIETRGTAHDVGPLASLFQRKTLEIGRSKRKSEDSKVFVVRRERNRLALLSLLVSTVYLLQQISITADSPSNLLAWAIYLPPTLCFTYLFICVFLLTKERVVIDKSLGTVTFHAFNGRLQPTQRRYALSDFIDVFSHLEFGSAEQNLVSLLRPDGRRLDIYRGDAGWDPTPSKLRGKADEWPSAHR